MVGGKKDSLPYYAKDEFAQRAIHSQVGTRSKYQRILQRKEVANRMGINHRGSNFTTLQQKVSKGLDNASSYIHQASHLQS